MHWALSEMLSLRAAAHARAKSLAQDPILASGNAWQIAVASEANQIVGDIERRHQAQIINTLHALWPREIEVLAIAMTTLPGANEAEIECLALRLRELRLIDIERAIAHQTLRLWGKAIRKLSGDECPWHKSGWSRRIRDH